MEAKPLQEERSALILELDKVLVNMRQLIQWGAANQLLTWVVQWCDLFIWSDKPCNEVWKCVDRMFPKGSPQFKCQWTRENCEEMDYVRFKRLDEFWIVLGKIIL